MIGFTFHESLDYEIPKLGEKTGAAPKTKDEMVDEFIDFQIAAKKERIKILKSYKSEESRCYFYRGYIKFCRNFRILMKNQNPLKEIEQIAGCINGKLAVVKEYNDEQKALFYQGYLNAANVCEEFYKNPKYPVFSKIERDD
jgi:hypothetical protein